MFFCTFNCDGNYDFTIEKKKKKKKILCLADEEVWGIKIEAFYLFLLFVL